MQNIIVRPIEENDLPGTRQLYLQAQRDTFTWINTDAYKLPDFDRDTEGEYKLIAIDNGEMVGFISVWLADNFIHHLYVGKIHQGKGIGTALLQTAIDKTGFLVHLKCVVKNTKADTFYRQKGFIITGKGNGEEGMYVVMQLNKTKW